MSVWVGSGGGGADARNLAPPAATAALISNNTSMESGIEAGVLPTVTGSLASAGDSLGSLSRAAEPMYDTDHTDLGSELDEAEIRRELMHDKWRLLFDRFDPEGFGEIPWPDFIETLQHPDFIAQVSTHKREILLDKAHSATSDAITFQEFVNVRATGYCQALIGDIQEHGSRLNKTQVSNMGSHAAGMLEVIGIMHSRIKELEIRTLRAEVRSLQSVVPSTTSTHAVPAAAVPSYATALKLRRGDPPRGIPSNTGHTLAIYPAETVEGSTAAATKKQLKEAIDPSKLQGVQVQSVRMVGNAGVVVQTTTAAAASLLKSALPPTLRVTEPKQRLPMIALQSVDGNMDFPELLEAIHAQNLKDDTDWPLSKLQQDCRLAFKKWRFNKTATKYVVSCSSQLRNKLLAKGRLFVGWQVVEVVDFLEVTCCAKCQNYGHPLRFCKATVETCSKCGKDGHRRDTCGSTTTACATCSHFGHKNAADHTTMARDCPARLHAEQRQLQMTHYG